MSDSKIAIITTHPIQYYAPLFRFLNKENSPFSIRVFYTLGIHQEKINDPDFGISFNWDVPLLEGYEFTFVNNISKNPSSRNLKGIINPTLIHEIENWKASAILVFGWAFISHLKVLRYFHNKIPVIFRGDSNLIDESSFSLLKKLARRVFLSWVYSYIDYAFYVGKANKAYYLAHCIKLKQLFFSPHAVDNIRFSNNEACAEAKAETWRSELGIGKNDFVFLFVAKIIQKKDPELLIKAFLSLSNPTAKLIIIGEGEQKVELKKRYRQHRDVIFIPFQNQRVMPVVYRLANIFVLPSRGPGETWGLAVNEAMACKRGVIVSDKSGCASDLVQPGKNGYIFRSGNEENLKNCMNLSLTRYKEFGSNSLRIIQDYTYENTYNQLKGMVEKGLI